MRSGNLRIRQAVIVLLMATCAGGRPALAEDAGGNDQAFSDIEKIETPLLLGPSIAAACDKAQPADHAAHAAALAEWLNRNKIDHYLATLKAAAGSNSELADRIKTLTTRATASARQFVDQHPEACGSLTAILATPALTLDDQVEAAAQRLADPAPSQDGVSQASGEPSAPAATHVTSAQALGSPGKGFATKDIATVLYKFTSSFRMDGFGNGSMKRDENTYILLNDGTAYLYPWSFAFQNVNVSLVRERMPNNWFTWAHNGSSYVLTHSDGPSKGKTIELDDDTRLSPLPPGATIDHHYFFLDVAPAGVQHDREYAFHRDGTVDIETSGLVAAKTAPGGTGVVASAPGGTFTGGDLNGFVGAVTQGGSDRFTYTIDGYSITLTDAKGNSIQTSIGLLADEQTPFPPKDIYFGGQTLWTHDD